MSIKPTPIEVFDYVYGVLHDPEYRLRFNEFLKRDYPRVPVVNNEADRDVHNAFYVSEVRFRLYVHAGARLRELHLLRDDSRVQPLNLETANLPDMEIGKVKYADGVLYINATTRIMGISEEVWNYRIGGYQVLDKWFKSHRGEALDREKFGHIKKVVRVLADTISEQKALWALHY